jgi:hypothetical protein
VTAGLVARQSTFSKAEPGQALDFVRSLMRRQAFFQCVLVIFISLGVTSAQVKDQPQKQRYIVVPRERTLVTVASQQECPLHIENAQLLLNVDKSWDFNYLYRLRNEGDKPIRAFTIVYLTSEGIGGILHDGRLKNQWLMPGQVIPFKREAENRTVIPLTEELREKLKLGPPAKSLVILMVESVEFADGTKFSDAKNFEALREHFQKLDDARN